MNNNSNKNQYIKKNCLKLSNSQQHDKNQNNFPVRNVNPTQIYSLSYRLKLHQGEVREAQNPRLSHRVNKPPSSPLCYEFVHR